MSDKCPICPIKNKVKIVKMIEIVNCKFSEHFRNGNIKSLITCLLQYVCPINVRMMSDMSDRIITQIAQASRKNHASIKNKFVKINDYQRYTYKIIAQKLLDDSSNPTLISAAYQGIETCPSTDCAKTINQGNVAKILQKIISAK